MGIIYGIVPFRENMNEVTVLVLSKHEVKKYKGEKAQLNTRTIKTTVVLASRIKPTTFIKCVMDSWIYL